MSPGRSHFAPDSLSLKICDAGIPTFMLTHWARDRVRGPGLPLEFLVHKHTQGNALAYGLGDRVATVVFSEFGRRAPENLSGGTDHGTAAPMYFVGDMVRPGVLGDHPSLTDLDQGDLKFTLDFRSVYAGVLEDWMKSDAKAVLGGSWRKAKIIRT